MKTYSLAPALHQDWKDLFSQQKAFVQELVAGLGSPLNILFPERAVENTRAFQRSFEQAGVNGRVYATHKPNKSQEVMKVLAATSTVRVDVSSYGEFSSALQAGFVGERIGATGIKSDEYLRLAVQHNATIIVDSIDELTRLEMIAQQYAASPVRILLRLCGFSSSHTEIRWKDSRFGIRLCDVSSVLGRLKEMKQLAFQGYAFHLSEASKEEKLVAIESALRATMEALQLGFSPSVLDIGGGFSVSYLEKAEEWDAYVSALKRSVMEGTESLSWDHSGLGFRNEGGVLRGHRSFAQSYTEVAGPQELAALLQSSLIGFQGATVAQMVNELLLEVWIEPGRSLYDQVGCTIGSVLGTKPSAQGEQLVVLDMNRTNLNTFDISVLMEPMLLTNEERVTPDSHEPVGVFYVGNLCSSDFLTRHKTWLPRLSQPGELIVFPNTAGYQMDFAESRTHLQPVARKVALYKRGEGFSWKLERE